MNIIKYPSSEVVDEGIRNQEPLLMLVSFDGETVLLSQLDDAVEHNLLLDKANKAGLVQADSRDIDKFFRAVVDESGADWTFVCPSDYRNIGDKTRRIAAFYKDGFAALTEALREIGLPTEIDIPKRYRRHPQMLDEDSPVL